MKKAKSQILHAKRRAKERFGLTLDKSMVKEIVRSIRSGKAKLLKHQSLRVSVFLVELQERTYPVVYDRKRKTIVTFLPKWEESSEPEESSKSEKIDSFRSFMEGNPLR